MGFLMNSSTGVSGYLIPLLRAVRPVEFREEVGSTQDLGFEMAAGGAPDGAVALAERQTAGRGGPGHDWYSPAGVGIWFSRVVRPPTPCPPVPMIVAATAIAVAEALQSATGADLLLRWPNDIMSGDLKLGGIVIETRDFDARAPLLVVGIGINVNLKAADFPPELQGTATSLRVCTSRIHDRTDLLEGMLTSLQGWLGRLYQGEAGALSSEYDRRVAYRGRRVTLLEGTTSVTGTLLSVSPLDGVRLRLDGGASRVVKAELAREMRPA